MRKSGELGKREGRKEEMKKGVIGGKGREGERRRESERENERKRV